MDKIKILAAALALAGCMENGFGMLDDIRQKRIPVTIDLNDKTSIWSKKVIVEDNLEIYISMILTFHNMKYKTWKI